MKSIVDNIILALLIPPGSFIVFAFLIFSEWLIFKSIIKGRHMINLKKIISHIKRVVNDIPLEGIFEKYTKAKGLMTSSIMLVGVGLATIRKSRYLRGIKLLFTKTTQIAADELAIGLIQIIVAAMTVLKVG